MENIVNLEEKNKKGDPFNFKRKVYHLGGLIIPGMLYFDGFSFLHLNKFTNDTRSITFFAIALVFVCMGIAEIIRFRSPAFQKFFLGIFGKMLKDKEVNNVQASIPFLFANAFIIGFFPKEVAVIAIFFLTFGDPAAAYFGGKYGTIRFYNKKSLQGVLGGIIGGFSFALLFSVFLAITRNDEPFFALWASSGIQWATVATIFLGAIVAMLAEFVSKDGFFDDNLSIPMTSAIIMTFFISVFQDKPFWDYINSIEKLIMFK